MRKSLLVVLSLVLVAAISSTAAAVDVKFSGEYYAAGLYLDKTSLQKDGGPSTAFYYQRLRLNTNFIVSPGLTLTTRMDIMERAWGANRAAPGIALDNLSSGTVAENQNIAFDLLYVDYVSKIGVFSAGYCVDGAWGNSFGDSAKPAGKIKYMIKIQNLILGLQMGKNVENSRTAINVAADGADKDSSFYTAYFMYNFKGGRAGLLGKYIRNAANRNLVPAIDTGYVQNVYLATPFVTAKIGPVNLKGEFGYATGKAQQWEGSPALIGQKDISIDQMYAYLDAEIALNMFYVGVMGIYVSGDNPDTTDKLEGGLVNGGQDFNPCLIMFNSDLNYWAGPQNGYGRANGGSITNAWFAQLRAGVKPVDKLDVNVSVAYAKADQKPAVAWKDKEYGYEIDLIATYRITNNLSYMLGAAYFFTGDYYKGISSINEVNNNYMVINKLTLTF